MEARTGAIGGGRVERRSLALTNGAIIGVLSALFVLPNLILAAGLKPLPAGILATSCIAALALLLRGRPAAGGFLDRPLQAGRLVGCIAVALGLLVLGGGMHLVYANPDWLVRDAVLADLARAPFPVGYDVAGDGYVLRAPLGMYMLPALVGRAVGLGAAHAALLAQNAVMLGCILYALTSVGRGWPHLAILVAFGGLAILWRAAQAAMASDPSLLVWIARPLDEWNRSFQYSSSITQFFWVPNHALPGWWMAALLILHARREVDAAVVAVSFAVLLFWSPLAVLPAIPMMLYSAAIEPRRVLLAARTWWGALTATGFLPVAVYLTLETGTIDHGLPSTEAHFVPRYLAFVVVQLAAAAGLVAIFWRRLDTRLRGLSVVSLIILLALPFFSFGPSNDLVLRASLSALVILAFCFGAIVIDLVQTRARVAIVGLAIVLLGAAPATVEIARAVMTPRFAISDCTLMQATRELGDTGAPANYMARADRVPGWLMPAPVASLAIGNRGRCWPDLKRPDVER